MGIDYPPQLVRFNFYVDALTSGDAEFEATESISAYSLEEAIDMLRTKYYDRGNVIFRMRQILDKPWNTVTVYLAKGQD